MPVTPLNTVSQYITQNDACCSANAGAPSLITAGGALDNVAVTGQTIDRKVAADGALAHSAYLCTAYLAALDTDETISFAITLQESADGTTWTTAEVVQAATVAATAAAAGNERGVVTNAIDLMSRRRYIRFNVTPNLSRANTDTATFHTIATFGGYDIIPQ